jgi:predicted DNA-binding protein (UPF0251 family)
MKEGLKQIMHEKAVRLINYGRITKVDMSKKLDISRGTLDTRLEKANWKIGELYILKSL